VLEVIAGYDPADPITRACEGKVPGCYRQFLDKEGLAGARIGVLRRYIETPTIDEQVKALAEQAIDDLKALGAQVVDPFTIPGFEELTEEIWCSRFQHDLNGYLGSLGDRAPYRTLAEIVDSGLYLPQSEERLKKSLAADVPPEQMEPPCLDVYRDARNIAFREAILDAMRGAGVDFLVYPTWSNPPRKVGNLESPAGDNSQLVSPATGFPAITVPMGFTPGGLPGGLTFVGKLFDEPGLIRVAYAYEQATGHRRPPRLYSE